MRFSKIALKVTMNIILSKIAGTKAFFPYTAALPPINPGENVLDLGYGTGLELEYYFVLSREASLVWPDLSPDMSEGKSENF